MILPALLSLLLTAPATRPAGADVAPAMYRYADADTTVYLFGSMHVLPDGLDWRSDAFDAAFDEATAVYFEVPLTPANLIGMQVKTMRAGTLPEGETLTGLLTEEEAEDLAILAERAGLPMRAVDRMRPSTAAATLVMAILNDTGLETSQGVEMTLAAELAGGRVEVDGLETVDEQVELLFGMPREMGLAMLRDMLDAADDPAGAAEEVRRMYDAWAAGDVEAMHGLVAELAEASPALYDRLIVDRNVAWVPALRAILEEREGTVLVVVGAGHVGGEWGVVPLLEEAGVEVERVQ